MPEIAEVARIVKLLKEHVTNKRILKVHAFDDSIVYGKVGATADGFQTAMSGNRIVDVKQQGKYFWLEMATPPHPLLHFGMTGWIRMNTVYTPYWDKGQKGAKDAAIADAWPPKFEKFRIEFEGGVEASFVDPRRLARIRLIDVPAKDMQNTTPLKENGPDPHIEREIFTKTWLIDKMKSRRVPVKVLLLDQKNISGIGNWVGDEVLYRSRLHPEQYCNTFSDEQVGRLHEAICFVVDTAIEVTAEKARFPKDWLFPHRKAGKLPTGEKIALLKVGGRTSAIVPSLQKKTGLVAGDVDSKASKRTAAVAEPEDDEKASYQDCEDEKPPKKAKKTSQAKVAKDVKKVTPNPAKGTRLRKKPDNH